MFAWNAGRGSSPVVTSSTEDVEENKSYILSEYCGSLWIVILSAGRSRRRLPPPHTLPWQKVSGQVPPISQQPRLPETRFLFKLLTTCAAVQLQPPRNLTMTLWNHVCGFLFLSVWGLLVNKEPSAELFFLPHSLTPFLKFKLKGKQMCHLQSSFVRLSSGVQVSDKTGEKQVMQTRSD